MLIAENLKKNDEELEDGTNVARMPIERFIDLQVISDIYADEPDKIAISDYSLISYEKRTLKI